MRKLCLIFVAAGLLPASGGLAQTSQPAAPAMPTVSLALSPQAIEKPVLQYALLPRVDETRPGNAAVKYLEAMEGLPAMSGERLTQEDYDAIDKLRSEPLAEVDEGQAGGYVKRYSYALRMIAEGAHLDSYDTESDIREKGYLAMLPSLGRYREIANVLMIATRLDIKHHRWAEAREKLATGYAMALHLSQGETVIEGLVGAAIANGMTRCLDDWMEQGGPNLYWELVNMPRPFVNMRRALAFERASAVFSFPELKEMREGKYSVDRWMALCNRFSEIAGWTDQGGAFPWSSSWRIGGAVFSGKTQQIGGVLYGVVEYPRAKMFLEARGMTKAEVEKMPVAEALERYFVRSYDEAADDRFKAFGLPPAQAVAESTRAEAEFMRSPNTVNLLARMFIPTLDRVPLLEARVDRGIDMLRIAEALRAYAADKGGFPDKLEDLELPVPRDAVTGQAFEYQRQGDTATVTSPAKNPRDGAVLVVRLKH